MHSHQPVSKETASLPSQSAGSYQQIAELLSAFPGMLENGLAEEVFNLILQWNEKAEAALSMAERERWLTYKAQCLRMLDLSGNSLEICRTDMEIGKCMLQQGKFVQAFHLLIHQDVSWLETHDHDLFHFYQELKTGCVNGLMLENDQLLMLAWECIESNQFAGALDLLQTVNREADNYELYLLATLRSLRGALLNENHVLVKLAWCKADQNNYQMALRYLDQCNVYGLGEADYRNYLFAKARCLRGLGQQEQAIAIYKSIENWTRDTAAINGVAFCLYETGYDEAAKKLFEMKDKLILKEAGQYLQAADFHKAEQMFATVKHSSLQKQALLGQAAASEGMRRFTTTEKIYQNLMQVFPDDREVYLGYCRYRLNRQAHDRKGHSSLKKAMCRWPQDAAFQQLKKEFPHAPINRDKWKAGKYAGLFDHGKQPDSSQGGVTATEKRYRQPGYEKG